MYGRSNSRAYVSEVSFQKYTPHNEKQWHDVHLLESISPLCKSALDRMSTILRWLSFFIHRLRGNLIWTHVAGGFCKRDIGQWESKAWWSCQQSSSPMWQQKLKWIHKQNAWESFQDEPFHWHRIESFYVSAVWHTPSQHSKSWLSKAPHTYYKSIAPGSTRCLQRTLRRQTTTARSDMFQTLFAGPTNQELKVPIRSDVWHSTWSIILNLVNQFNPLMREVISATYVLHRDNRRTCAHFLKKPLFHIPISSSVITQDILMSIPISFSICRSIWLVLLQRAPSSAFHMHFEWVGLNESDLFGEMRKTREALAYKPMSNRMWKTIGDITVHVPASATTLWWALMDNLAHVYFSRFGAWLSAFFNIPLIL